MEMVREMRRFRVEMRSFSPHLVHAQFGTATAMFAALGAGRTPLVITFREAISILHRIICCVRRRDAGYRSSRHCVPGTWYA